MREAAQDDNVSYETKRTQQKSIATKLGYKRQVDLLTDLLSELFLEILSVKNNSAKNNARDQYVARYFPRPLRRYKILDSNNAQQEILDIGPPDGKPLIVLHSTFISNLSQQMLDQLTAYNIRLLLPLRNGLLDPAAPLLTSEQHLQFAISGIDTARSLIPQKKCVLYAIATGTRIAIEYANQKTQNVEKIIFQSTAISKHARLFSKNTTLSGISKLALHSPLTLNTLFAFLQRKMRDPQSAKKYLLNTFARSPLDLAIIERNFDLPEFGQRTIELLEKSFHSMCHDFNYMSDLGLEKLKHDNIPIAFIHGSNDGISPLYIIEKFVAELGRGDIITIENCGHFISVEHLPQLMQAIQKILEQ